MITAIHISRLSTTKPNLDGIPPQSFILLLHYLCLPDLQPNPPLKASSPLRTTSPIPLVVCRCYPASHREREGDIIQTCNRVVVLSLGGEALDERRRLRI